MSSDWIAVQDILPWVPQAPYLISSNDAARLRSGLRAAGFRVFDADVADCVDEACLLAAIGDALPFPDYFGRNWDAFFDCLGGLQHEGSGPTALVIDGAGNILRSRPHVFTRSVHLLQAAVEQVAGARVNHFQFEVFFLGNFELL